MWAGVLTQPYTKEIEGKVVTTHHPVTYVSGLFRGSQLNWAALTKETYAMYMSIKKLSFYLTDSEITLRSDHLPLKKFLLKNALNSKVNNWAVQLETFNIKFEHISGIKNTIADTLSRIIKAAYLSIRHLYYWNNMKKDILRHCKQCAVCKKFKVECIKFEKLHFSIPNQLMELICMDLTGELYPPTSRGHRYALTVMDMVTGFVFCAPLKSKKAKEVTQTYLNEVYYRFGGSRKILSDNGTEFKNKMFKEVAKKLGLFTTI